MTRKYPMPPSPPQRSLFRLASLPTSFNVSSTTNPLALPVPLSPKFPLHSSNIFSLFGISHHYDKSYTLYSATDTVTSQTPKKPAEQVPKPGGF